MADLLARLGFACARGTHARMRDMFPQGRFSANEHCEIDFLIAEGRFALLGEITARSGKRDLERKYSKFRGHIRALETTNRTDAVWTALGVPADQLAAFRRVRTLIGFFITTKAEQFDVDVDLTIPRMAVFFRSSVGVLENYADCIGEFAKSHFLDRLEVNLGQGRRPIEIRKDTHGLLRVSDRTIVGSADATSPEADVFTFEVSPYDLLGVSRVFRKDELPAIGPTSALPYQRPLIKKKLDEIRAALVRQPNFLFPNSILAVLGANCAYTEDD